MLRRLYDWTIRLAEGPRATLALAIVAFVESSVFPIPPDALLLPMVLAAPHRAWRIAAIATVFSVLGGAFGYWIGYAFYESIGGPMLEFYGKADRIGEFRATYSEWGGWAVLAAGITPFPYKVITIASGVLELDLKTFMVSSVIARGLRFFIIAALLWKFGAPIRDFIERRLGLAFTLALAVLVGGFALVKYVI